MDIRGGGKAQDRGISKYQGSEGSEFGWRTSKEASGEWVSLREKGRRLDGK